VDSSLTVASVVRDMHTCIVMLQENFLSSDPCHFHIMTGLTSSLKLLMLFRVNRKEQN
jgi:hypothetical protein